MSSAAARRVELGLLAGWGRAGDAYHVVPPRPDGAGLARAIGVALRRAGVTADAVGYVNAHGSGTPQSDSAEAAALRRALGPHTARSARRSRSTAQALEASGLLEFVIRCWRCAAAAPVNAGFLARDETCALNLVLDGRPAATRYALTVNSAFGGANTALLVGADRRRRPRPPVSPSSPPAPGRPR